MALDRKGSRSSRRLQGVAPEPLSPPQSEGGNSPVDARSRKASTQRVSIRDTTGLVSPALSVGEVPPAVPPLRTNGAQDRRLTRRQAAAAGEEKDATGIRIGQALNPAVAPTRQSKRLSHAMLEGLNSRETGPKKKLRVSLNGTMTENIETENVSVPLPLPPRGLITNRRAINPPLIFNYGPVTGKQESSSQTRISKRKVEATGLVALPTESTEIRHTCQQKRQKIESNLKFPPELRSKAKVVQIDVVHEKPRGRGNNIPIIEVEKQKVTARRNSKAFQLPTNAIPEKPQAIGKPAVWCDTRQELCESLPSFRSYQGGCYASKGFGRGYLIDGHASERDYMDASVIISHAGGNSEEVEGERRLVRDQTWDKGVIAYLRNNYEQMVPLIVIIGERCPTAPAHLEHRYSVLDWFKVTHCWPEKDSKSGNIRCKFRLEKLDSSKKGWWAAADTPGVSKDTAVEYINCPGCRQNSPWIYDKEPMCLNKDCKRFWTVHSGRSGRAPERFVYRKSFLHGKTVWPEAATIPPGPLGPVLPIDDEITESHGRDVKRKFWKGMWCQSCGKLNCRELWKSWKCTNCDWEFVPKRSYFIPADLSDQHRPDYTGPPIPENIVDPSIKSESTVLPDGRRAMVYHVYQCGKVIHILANKTWNALPGGSNWLLEHYQDVDMPFKRHELKTHKLTGRLLTQQFSFNSGAPYKYIVEVDSLSFEQSPKVVQQALETLQTDVTRMIPDALPMNEVLNVAYFEEQKMDFHDDGEEDLGPCVSSISLGSPAMMYFRVKAKYCNGSLSAADKALLQPSSPSPSGSENNKRSSKRNILELRLHHGDVIIMNGRSIQRLLEHAVTPEGFRIAATARNISSYNAVVNSNNYKFKRIAESHALSHGTDEVILKKHLTGQFDEMVRSASIASKNKDLAQEHEAGPHESSDTTKHSSQIGKQAAFQIQTSQEQGNKREENPTTSMAISTPLQQQTQINRYGLRRLSIPQESSATTDKHEYSAGTGRVQTVMPPVRGDTTPSVIATSPTSSLPTPDFRYYNINAASATPIEPTRRLGSAQESISPLTITPAVTGDCPLRNVPDRMVPGSFADPRISMRPPSATRSLQAAGTSLPPQGFAGSESVDWRQYEGGRTPLPSPWPRPSLHRYGDQNLFLGQQAGVYMGNGSETGSLPGWSSDQVRRLQTMFLYDNN